MRPWTKIYMDAMGYDVSDCILCEICSRPSNDLHHIQRRGIGGSKTKDTIENLMALCRPHHIQFGDKKQHMDYLKEIHALRMKERGLTLT